MEEQDDILNDETFGTAGVGEADEAALPSFFRHHGTTLLEELGQLGEADANSVEDDILYEPEDFGHGLPDFFKIDYSQPHASSQYDSWMGAATGEDILPPPNVELLPEDEDALEAELQRAQKHLEAFAFNEESLTQPYQAAAPVQAQAAVPAFEPIVHSALPVPKSYSSMVTGAAAPSLPVPPPPASQPRPAAPANMPAAPLHISGAKLASMMGGARGPAPMMMPPPPPQEGIPLPIAGTLAPALSQPTIAPPLQPMPPQQPPARPGPWNKPLPNFDVPPRGAAQPPPPRGWQRGGPQQYAPQQGGPMPGRGGFHSGPPPRPFYQGPPPQQQQPAFFQNEAQRLEYMARRQLPHGTKMSPNEVRFVLSKVFEPFQTLDPFHDDYYAIQFAMKRSNERAAAAVKNNESIPPPPIVPLPTWRDVRERVLKQIESSKQAHADRVAHWEKKEHVLGHIAKTNFATPKQLLSVDFSQGDENEESGGAISGNNFTSVLWNMRLAVSRGFNALHTVQELYQLLSTPMVANNPVARNEILSEVSDALTLLSRSVGILPHTGAVPGATDGSSEVLLEGGLVAALLQTIKGKKLISRSLRHLNTAHRWALTPVILARTLQVVRSGPNAVASNPEDEAVEQRLMKVLVQFFQSDSALSDENLELGRVDYSVSMLQNLRQCIKTVMVSQMEKSRLREALLSSRYRAEAMHNIILAGDKIAKHLTESSAAAQQWVEMREAFMAMLDA